MDEVKEARPEFTTAAQKNEGIFYEPDELPELDFGGETVTMLSRGLKNGGFSFYETNLTVEELTSDVLNDSIYNRELYVEDRLNVEIENVKVSFQASEIKSFEKRRAI